MNSCALHVGLVALSMGMSMVPVRAQSNGKWPTGNVVLHATQFLGQTLWGQDMRVAVERFNLNSSNCRITIQWDGVLNPSFKNGISEIYLDNNAGYPAYTQTDVVNGIIREADIIIQPNEPWGVTSGASFEKLLSIAYGGSKRPFRNSFLHELGHAVGLLHNNKYYNLMGRPETHVYCNADQTFVGVGEYANSELRRIYGTKSNYPGDCGASFWKYGGAAGEYALHVPCEVTNFAGTVEMPSTVVDGQKRYELSRGGAYNFEFTFENNGSTQEQTDVNWRISTNNYISGYDRSVLFERIAQHPQLPWTEEEAHHDSVRPSGWADLLPRCRRRPRIRRRKQ